MAPNPPIYLFLVTEREMIAHQLFFSPYVTFTCPFLEVILIIRSFGSGGGGGCGSGLTSEVRESSL